MKPILKTLCLFSLLAIAATGCSKSSNAGQPGTGDAVKDNALLTIDQGRQTFRSDTFGDEAFWGDTLKLHLGVAKVSPKTALSVGLKVDVDALPQDLVDKLKNGSLNLDDPANTLALIKLNSILGVTGFFNTDGSMKSIGIQCAFCHSTVDDSLAAGIGHRLDGWANRDLNVGAIVNLSPDLSAVAALLGVDDATVRAVLNGWGAGRYDAQLFLDGQAAKPGGALGSAATLIPPAFGLAGVNLHTSTGWGSVTYWNAFVANLEMHGKGTFSDSRLRNLKNADGTPQFPVAIANNFDKVTPPNNGPDLITPKLPALQIYQLAIQAPPAVAGTFDAAAAARGKALFSAKAKCATCHVLPIFTEPGWNMHAPADIGIDSFQADRGPDKRYRTTPLKGLWTHQKGGFYHDGRFPALLDVVNHYDTFMRLGLTDLDKSDLVEYLKS